jgi:hypothetical protein
MPYASSAMPTPPALQPPAAAVIPPLANPSTANGYSHPTTAIGVPVVTGGFSDANVKPATGSTSDSLSSGNDGVRNLAPPPNMNTSTMTIPTTTPSPTTANPSDGLIQSKFDALMEAVRKKLDEGKLSEAHLALSILYGNPDLPPNQAQQINDLLDRLTGTVIYSRQHCLEPAYITQQGDTIDRIAQKYDVPWQLLARINGLMSPDAPNTDSPTKDQPLPAGKELKVVRGPFEAVVHLDRHELTLMVQNRYAGRFPIGIGRDQPQLDGNYTVRNKTLKPAYYGPDDVNLGPDDPKNPLGGAWIGLTDRIGIHGANSPQAIGHDNNRGSICVGDRDLQDLYGILSVGSRVTIVR